MSSTSFPTSPSTSTISSLVTSYLTSPEAKDIATTLAVNALIPYIISITSEAFLTTLPIKATALGLAPVAVIVSQNPTVKTEVQRLINHLSTTSPEAQAVINLLSKFSPASFFTGSAGNILIEGLTPRNYRFLGLSESATIGLLSGITATALKIKNIAGI